MPTRLRDPSKINQVDLHAIPEIPFKVCEKVGLEGPVTSHCRRQSAREGPGLSADRMYGGDARRYPSQYWRTRLRAISIHQADACLEPSGREGKYPMAAADILTYSSRRRRLRPFTKSALGADPRAKAHPVRASADGAVDVRVPGSQEPFVGRTAELDALAEAYAQASDGHTRIVCVEGPAGSARPLWSGRSSRQLLRWLSPRAVTRPK